MNNKMDRWSELDASIEALIQGNTQSEHTRRWYARNWAVWERFCADKGYPALGAPMDAFREMWAAAKTGMIDPNPRSEPNHPGVPLKLGTLDQLFAAVADKHRSAGLVAAYQRDEHREEHSELRRGWKRAEDTTGVTKRSALALRPEHIAAILSVTPASTDSAVARRALAFMMADSDMTWAELSSIHPEQISESPEDDGVLVHVGRQWVFPHVCPRVDRSGDTSPEAAKHSQSLQEIYAASGATRTGLGDLRTPDFIAGDHADPAIASVPVVCTGCLVSAARRLPSGVPLAQNLEGRGSTRAIWGQIVKALISDWRAVFPDGRHAFRIHPEGNTWLLAGTRYGIYELLGNEGLTRTATQARIALAWSVGLRTQSDIDFVTCDGLTIFADGRSTLRIPRSKGDQTGQGAILPFHAPDDAEQMSFVYAWAAIRNAMHGATSANPLFCSWNTLYLRVMPDALRSSNSVTRDWRWLQDQAGISGFTLHSARTGFASTATEIGHAQTDVQTTLRLKKPETAMGYMRQARPVSAPVARLIDRMEGSA